MRRGGEDGGERSDARRSSGEKTGGRRRGPSLEPHQCSALMSGGRPVCGVRLGDASENNICAAGRSKRPVATLRGRAAGVGRRRGGRLDRSARSARRVAIGGGATRARVGRARDEISIAIVGGTSDLTPIGRRDRGRDAPAVFGVTSWRRVISMRPAGSPPMVMSKKTTGLDIASVGERRRVDRSKGLEK